MKIKITRQIEFSVVVDIPLSSEELKFKGRLSAITEDVTFNAVEAVRKTNYSHKGILKNAGFVENSAKFEIK